MISHVPIRFSGHRAVAVADERVFRTGTRHFVPTTERVVYPGPPVAFQGLGDRRDGDSGMEGDAARRPSRPRVLPPVDRFCPVGHNHRRFGGRQDRSEEHARCGRVPAGDDIGEDGEVSHGSWGEVTFTDVV